MLEIFSAQYQFNQQVILRGIKDISQEESLWNPPTGGNCINFIVGHIIASRANLLALLGADTFWTKEKCLPYIQGAAAVVTESAYFIRDLEAAIIDIMPQLEHAVASSDLTRLDSDGDSHRDTVATSICHEAYHAGQIHLVRRLLGRARSFG